MIDHSAALINELQRHGITISVDDIPGILRSGIDTLLDRHGLELKAEDTTVLHLILHSIRERDPPGRGGVPKRNIDPPFPNRSAVKKTSRRVSTMGGLTFLSKKQILENDTQISCRRNGLPDPLNKLMTYPSRGV